MDLEFRDEAGRTVSLKEYFGRRPVILSLVYYSCQDLCPLTLDALVRKHAAAGFQHRRSIRRHYVASIPAIRLRWRGKKERFRQTVFTAGGGRRLAFSHRR